MNTRLHTVLLGCLLVLVARCGHSALVADLIIHNAVVRTMDAQRPVVEAVAISDSRIAATGADREIKLLAGPQTRIIDARGQLVLPGFNDAHVHFLAGVFQLSNVDLRNADSPQEFAERIRKFAVTLPKGK